MKLLKVLKVLESAINSYATSAAKLKYKKEIKKIDKKAIDKLMGTKNYHKGEDNE